MKTRRNIFILTKKSQVFEKSTLNVICGRTIVTIAKQLNKLNVKFISEMEKIK